MTVEEILRAKGALVQCISPKASLDEAVRRFTEDKVGALVTYRDGEPEGTAAGMAGIITERDVIRRLAKGACNLASIQVGEIMSTQLVTVGPSDKIEDLMNVMTERRIRHLPVVSEGRLVGIVSIGDLLKAERDHLATENRFMRKYIQG